jgi:tripartite-type tricarboxylate transporter receptor subunit TctC
MLQVAAPRDIVWRLNTEMRHVLAQPDVRQMMTSVRSEVVPSSPEEFAAYIRNGRRNGRRSHAKATSRPSNHTQ